MKNVTLVAVMLVSCISMTSFAQDKKVGDLKNPTIKAFLTSLDGSEAAAEKAVAKFCSSEVIENGMIPTGKLMKVISEEDNCVRFQTLWVIDEDDAEDGTEVMIYDICEEAGKITSFDLDFGDDEEE